LAIDIELWKSGRLGHLADDAEQYVRRVGTLDTESDRRGGFICIRGLEVDSYIFGMPIGEINPEKREKYELFAEEKMRRLMKNPSHFSSWQTRNPEEGKWGGAIRLPQCLLSFSGLPELLDEAFMVGLAYRSDLIGRTEAHIICTASNNRFLRDVLTMISR